MILTIRLIVGHRGGRARRSLSPWLCLVLLLGTTSRCKPGPSSKVARESPTSQADPGVAVAPADTSWPDPAAHRSGYVSNGGVRIHYLDFGGNGEPLVLLTGLGSSAHIYDDLAPRFTDRFHVVAMTRRGHAESDHPKSGYSLDTLVGDLKALLDTLGLRRVNLAGHSIAGGELTRFAVLHPERVTRLIYIDAMLNPEGLGRFVAGDTIKVKATAADLDTYESARAWFQRCFYGFWSPALEADFRINTTPSEVTDLVLQDALHNSAWRPNYSAIQAPALVLYTLATLEHRRPCVAQLPDQDRVRRARAFLDQEIRPNQLAGVERLRRAMPHAKIVELHGHHFLFVSNQAEVIREMRTFLR